MKKKLVTALLFTTVAISSYALGTTQGKVTKIHTIPKGYIALEECIPLDDISCYYINGYGYPCFELGDIGNQLDDPRNTSYDKILSKLENQTEEYRNSFIDMREVWDFTATETGFQLYLHNGEGYYWQRGE